MRAATGNMVRIEVGLFASNDDLLEIKHVVFTELDETAIVVQGEHQEVVFAESEVHVTRSPMVIGSNARAYLVISPSSSPELKDQLKKAAKVAIESLGFRVIPGGISCLPAEIVSKH